MFRRYRNFIFVDSEETRRFSSIPVGWELIRSIERKGRQPVVVRRLTLAFIVVAFLVAVAFAPVGSGDLFVTDPDAPVLQDSQLLDRDSDTPISIVVLHREDAKATAQTLLILDQERDVQVRVDGEGYFLYPREGGSEVETLKEVSYRSNRVIVPAIIPPAYPEKAYLFITVDGASLADRIEVYQQTREVFQVQQQMPAMRAIVLRWVEGEYALIDQSLLNHTEFVRQYLANQSEYKRLLYALPDEQPPPMLDLDEDGGGE